MIWHILHIIDIIIWLAVAISVAYILFFAIAALFYKKDKVEKLAADDNLTKFLVIIPAYKADEVLLATTKSFLQQTYPTNHYTLAVVADKMTDATIAQLQSLPCKVIVPHFDKSSKAKALRLAVSEAKSWQEDYDNVVILDVDNIVETDFLEVLNPLCRQGYRAIQCHRCAKNADNGVAVMDGVSEEINNSIFRKGHNAIGLSAALIGSGMCFNYPWFAESVETLSTAGEDRELEVLLLRQNIHVHYAADIPVMDEKVNDVDNFQRQRLRWMTAQVQSFITLVKLLPEAIKKGNINLLNKTLQQALIPRSILLALTFAMAVLLTAAVSVWAAKWWLLFILTCLALIIAMPGEMRRTTLFRQLTVFPAMVWRMVKNIAHIDHKNTDFLHTTHKEKNE